MSDGMQLDLKKPLDKMTAKELRELVLKQVPQVTGASGLGKDELLVQIKEALGMGGEGGVKTSPYKTKILSMKQKMRSLRTKRTEVAGDGSRKQKEILRRQINKLKKRTRRLAKA
ncbi:hypothetical protein [Desulfovibrio sp. TomC]|uniref:hypothetical protein n=1 Tax=Desulfovibrio sp. TomC TaxID=1562888 RepID=UPI0005752682|nr:hypothetical protein [Desulfovibrio sp. TomC]KHK02395.1 hypothetical protein NY78_2153 [Desulfovibrio sp. TomC]